MTFKNRTPDLESGKYTSKRHLGYVVLNRHQEKKKSRNQLQLLMYDILLGSGVGVGGVTH